MGVIYKITSPTGKVYIGQTVDLSNRLCCYRTLKCKSQGIIFNSLLKYGFDSHEVKIVHDLPHDVSREVLNSYEKLYIQLYKDSGVEMMNIKSGGGNYERTIEYKESVKERTKGKSLEERFGNIVAVEMKIKIAATLKGRKKSESHKTKISESQKGKKIPRDIVERVAAKRRANGNYNTLKQYWEKRRDDGSRTT